MYLSAMSSKDNDQTNAGLGILMERYVDGDESAFVGLHARLSSRIRSQIRSKIVDTSAAEDLVQTVFLKAHRARERFVAPAGSDPDRAVIVWYATIARNTVYDHLRRHYRNKTVLVGGTTEATAEVLGDIRDVRPTSEAAMLHGERQQSIIDRVRTAIEGLPQSQREVVSMHRLEGLNMGEISERTGVREGTLRVRAHRGYRALEAALTGFRTSLAGA